MDDILNSLIDTVEDLVTSDLDWEALKAGRRNSVADQALIDQGYDIAMQLCDLFESLGATVEEEDEGESDTESEDEEAMGMEMEGKAERYGGKKRDDLDDSDFVDPDRRSFPIMTAQDVKDAVSSWGRYKGEMTFEQFKARLSAIAKKKGLEGALPAAWGNTKDADLSALKGIEFAGLEDGEQIAILPGYAVKTVGDTGLVEGYLVRYGGNGDLSEWRDIFTRSTDYGRHTKSDAWVHHRMLPGLGKRRLTNQADLSFDDEGVFVKLLLNLRNSYESKLYGLARAGKLGWSSGSAPHLVERKALDDGRHEVTQWILGLDASLTPTPAGGLMVNASVMKSLFDEAGLDLLTAIYEDDAEIKSTDDGERARSLSLELDLLELEIT